MKMQLAPGNAQGATMTILKTNIIAPIPHRILHLPPLPLPLPQLRPCGRRLRRRDFRELQSTATMNTVM